MHIAVLGSEGGSEPRLRRSPTRCGHIITYSKVATPRLGAITANSSTPHIAAFTDLQKGPAVLEVSTAGPDGTLYGHAVDAWQFTIADIGPGGMDAGKGGKYLFTPPGYKGEVPKSYIHVASSKYRIAFAPSCPRR